VKPVVYSLIAGLIVGNTFGALAPINKPERVYVRGRATQPGVAPRSRRADREGDCPDLRGEQLQQLETAWATLEEAESEQAQVQASLVEVIGEEPSFDGYPEELLPDAIEETVLALIDEEISELQWVDCSEAPCVVVLRMRGPDSDEVETMRRAADPMRDALGSSFAWEWFGIGGDQGEYMTIPLGPDSSDSLLNHRIDLREEIIIRELVAAGLDQ